MTPTIYTHPVKRPGIITQANWLGDDDDLSLQIVYTNPQGGNAAFDFYTRNAERKGNVCLPSSNDVLDLGESYDEGPHELLDGDHYYSGEVSDIIVAHASMATHISRQGIPGSQEFQDSLISQLASPNWLQTAIGTVKITDYVPLDDRLFFLECKKGSGPARWILSDYGTFLTYNYVPQTQLLTIAGAIEKQFSGHVHDHPNDVLTENQKADIAAYVPTLAQWL